MSGDLSCGASGGVRARGAIGGARMRRERDMVGARHRKGARLGQGAEPRGTTDRTSTHTHATPRARSLLHAGAVAVEAATDDARDHARLPTRAEITRECGGGARDISATIRRSRLGVTSLMMSLCRVARAQRAVTAPHAAATAAAAAAQAPSDYAHGDVRARSMSLHEARAMSPRASFVVSISSPLARAERRSLACSLSRACGCGARWRRRLTTRAMTRR